MGVSGDRGCGWCGGAGVVEVVCSVRMGVGTGGPGNRGGGVGTGGPGNRGGGVVGGGGNVSVTDGGADHGGARWRDCCRIPNGIFGKLWEDLPYHLPFTFKISNVFL